MCEVVPDDALSELALNVLEGSLEMGWDEAYGGGILYMMDVLGPSSKAVYRLGCHAQPFPWGCGDGKSMASGGWECGLLNADVKG